MLRAGDVAARSGGDEFVLILPATDLEGAEQVVRRLHEVLPVAWSHGATPWPASLDWDAAMVRADAELYRCKARRHSPGD